MKGGGSVLVGEKNENITYKGAEIAYTPTPLWNL